LQREHQEQVKIFKQKKKELEDGILSVMRNSDIDVFDIEDAGSLVRSTRTTRPRLKRATIRTQLLLQFSDQPEKVGEVLRAIEGVPADAHAGDDMTAGGTQTETLTRRIPRKKPATKNIAI
jgi:hypothetical protein